MNYFVYNGISSADMGMKARMSFPLRNMTFSLRRFPDATAI